MSIKVLSGLLSLTVLATACNPKKFDGGVASRESTPKTKIEKEEVTIPPAKPVVPATSTVDTLPAGPDQPLPAVPQVVPEVDKTVEFGAAEVFRIGDGFASANSECVGQVNTFKLSGTKYYFQFEVMENDTSVDLSIGRVCGVDRSSTDTFSLLNEQTKALELAEKPIPQKMEFGPTNPYVPYPAFKLKKGIYSVVIHSKHIYGKEVPPGTPIDPSKDEYDDFIVGNIKIKATNRVKAIKIYAE